MSPQKARPPARKGKPPPARKGRTAAAARQSARRTDRTAWIAGVVILAIGATLVFAFASAATKKKTTVEGDRPAAVALVEKVTGVPLAVAAQVGQGTSKPLPTKLPGPPLMGTDGKPRVVYIGAEYCPYCAAERWALVAALSRFGTFKNLQITQSAGGLEAFPNTPTFSFYKSSYSSPYLTFEPVETETNAKKPLETPTAEQSALMAKWDAPPYVTQANQNAIPFIDFANLYLISGASYDAGVLSRKTHDQIAAALSDPTSAISKGVIGTANVMTASICALTKDKPANVCTDPTIKGLETQLKAQ
jgi:hypothetical protein